MQVCAADERRSGLSAGRDILEAVVDAEGKDRHIRAGGQPQEDQLIADSLGLDLSRLASSMRRTMPCRGEGRQDVSSGEGQLLMKGNVKTEVLLKAS